MVLSQDDFDDPLGGVPRNENSGELMHVKHIQAVREYGLSRVLEEPAITCLVLVCSPKTGPVEM